MRKISLEYKQLPSQDNLTKLNWYIIFIGTIDNIPGVDHVCQTLGMTNYALWAPTYQEYCRFQSDLVLVDRLIYTGYVLLGVEDVNQICQLSVALGEARRGFILGGTTGPLNIEELNQVYNTAQTYSTAPKLEFDIQTGDSVIIGSGFLSGFRATVTEVLLDLRKVKLEVFFMNRELEVEMSILDIQSLGTNSR